jgi:predicted nucleic acid-binding protein
MIRIFLDASVVFAAAYSHSGAARELLHRGLQGDVRLVVSQDVLEETTRNLAVMQIPVCKI